MPGIIVDIGTGDGKFVHQLARENPDRFVIGIDPSQGSVERTSAKIYKKPAKGGVKNALFVLSDVLNLPEELNGLANQVYINFPWGSLLEGVLKADKTILGSIRRICKQAAVVEVLLSLGHEDNISLPELSAGYFLNLKPGFSESGFELAETKKLANEDLRQYPSSWAKKLSHGKVRDYFYLKLIAE